MLQTHKKLVYPQNPNEYIFLLKSERFLAMQRKCIHPKLWKCKITTKEILKMKPFELNGIKVLRGVMISLETDEQI